MNPRETAELEAERFRLEREPAPRHWDRASWIRGAMYALAWVINRRGAEMAPLEAAQRFVSDVPRKQHRRSVFRFANGMIAVTDEHGNQVMDLQGQDTPLLRARIDGWIDDATLLYGYRLTTEPPEGT